MKSNRQSARQDTASPRSGTQARVIVFSRIINLGKRRPLIVGEAANDNDGITVNHDVQRSSTIEGGGDEGQRGSDGDSSSTGEEKLGAGSGSGAVQRGGGGTCSSTGGEQLAAGSGSRAGIPGETLLEVV